MKYARIDETGFVIETIELNPEECFHPDVAKLFEEVPDSVEAYWRIDRETGKWTEGHPPSFPDEPIIPSDNLEETKAKKLHELNIAFKAATESAHLMSSLGFEVDANEEANRNVSGLVRLMSSDGAPKSIEFCDYNNNLHPVTLEDLKTIDLEIISNGSALYAKKWEYRTKIQNAASKEELEKLVIDFSTAPVKE